MKRKTPYLLLTIICFGLCVLIVITLSEYTTIRGFIGDVIVTILIYCFVKIFIELKPLILSILVLLFSYTVEVLQYFHFIDLIGLGENRVARIIIGTTFAYSDLIAYLIGIIIIYLIDKLYFESELGINRKQQFEKHT